MIKFTDRIVQQSNAIIERLGASSVDEALESLRSMAGGAP